ncbi:isoprenoid synthase domain-containing protein [Triangularia verruculosa]|uniref:Isoprenoid synthase domain-containing protein n=1 Tax=Triangularia verruculosa TaxID=2587418 RepID=A0AAN6XE09_9PEZI|nr:isoprenoid synthase domain-containing protein [Triangularia verruculosa]
MAPNDYFTQQAAPPTAEAIRLSQYAHTEAAEARQDWIKYIGSGPVGEYGGCNPADGYFCALVLPMCKPERLRLPTTPNGTTTPHTDAFTLGRRTNIESDRKQLQAKTIQQLLRTDKPCAERIINTWKTMLATTLKQKSTSFSNLDEYLTFRIVDTGAPFVEATMLFGMGLTLPNHSKPWFDETTRPCFASLALANDYFSFDREYAEFCLKGREEKGEKLINAVWLCMKWHGVGPEVAKGMVREPCNGYEREFLRRCEGFLGEGEVGGEDREKWGMYFRGLQHQVSGNVVWSLRCPRYHPEERGFDPNAGVEDQVTKRIRKEYVGGKNSGDVEDGRGWGSMGFGERGLEVTSPGVEVAM